MDAWVAPRELDCNRSETEVGAHCEIGDRGHHGDQGCDVVEDAVGTRLGEGKADEDEGGKGHDGADGL